MPQIWLEAKQPQLCHELLILYLLTSQKKTEQLGTTIRANNEELIPERLRNEKIMMIGETSLD